MGMFRFRRRSCNINGNRRDGRVFVIARISGFALKKVNVTVWATARYISRRKRPKWLNQATYGCIIFSNPCMNKRLFPLTVATDT